MLVTAVRFSDAWRTCEAKSVGGRRETGAQNDGDEVGREGGTGNGGTLGKDDCEQDTWKVKQVQEEQVSDGTEEIAVGSPQRVGAREGVEETQNVVKSTERWADILDMESELISVAVERR